jgi:hypothetical protein
MYPNPQNDQSVEERERLRPQLYSPSQDVETTAEGFDGLSMTGEQFNNGNSQTVGPEACRRGNGGCSAAC